MSDVFGLVDEMEGYFEECKNVPFSNKIVVDMEAVYEFITDLRLKLPEEIKRSMRILEERDKIIQDARREADDAIHRAQREAEDAIYLAQQRVNQLVDEHEITKKAYEKADEIMVNARETAKEMKAGAYEYVDELIEQTEVALQDTIEQTTANYQKFDNYVRHQMKVLSNNRSDLEQRKAKSIE